MKKFITLFLFLGISVFAQGQGLHNPDITIGYSTSPYSVQPKMRQASNSTNLAKSTITSADATDLFVHFYFDTSGKTIFIVYTTNGTAPTKTNGTVVNCSYSNYIDPNRTWRGSIPQQSPGVEIRYVFYSSNTIYLSDANVRVAADGGKNTWTEGDSYFSFRNRHVSVSNGNWNSSSTWHSSSIPNSSSNEVELNNSVTLNAEVQVNTLQINSGGTFNGGSNTLTITSGGSLINSGTFSGASGKVAFAGTGTVSGTNDFNNVDLSGNVSFGAGSVINGALDIKSGGTATLNADISLKGNFINAGTLTHNSRLVTFNGSSTQTISGSSTTTFGSVTFANDVSLSSNISASNGFTINSGKTLTANSQTITLSSGVNFSNSGTFTAGTGKVVFSGSSTISGTNTFYDVDINGAVNFGSSTVNNKLTVLSGGSATGTISYGTNATLEYNGRTGFTASNEWPASNGPKNVILTSNSAITAPSTTRTLDGDLTINSGSTFTLSGTSGSDLALKGNLVNSGTLSPNGRLFTFSGNTPQTISGGGTTSFTLVQFSNDVSLNSTSISVGNSLTIDASKTLTCNSNNVTIGSGGTFTNNGNFLAGTGKVIFSGIGTVTGTVGFNNVDMSGAVNFGANSTINGTLDIKSGGYVASGNAPIYATNSTLRYSSGGTYDRFAEWFSSGGKGLPYNVQISNNTTLNLAANGGTGEARTINGNLTIDAGSSLRMQQADQNLGMIATLTVNGDIVNSGTLSLSPAVGGDLVVKGNFTNNGTFTHNSRLVSFNGSTTQTIGGSSTATFGYLLFDNNVALTNNISAANTFVINSGKTLNAGSQTITLISGVNCSNSGTFTAGTGKVVFLGASTISGTNTFYDVELNGAVDFGTSSTINNILTYKTGSSVTGTLKYHATSSTLNYSGITVSAGNEFPATDGPANITLTNNSSVTFGIARSITGKVIVANGSSLVVTNTLVFNNFELSGSVNFGTASTLNGTMTFKTGGSVTTAPAYGASSTLEYSGITGYTSGNEFPASNGPKNLSLISSSSVAVGGDRTIAGNLSIQSGSTLSVSGDRTVTMSGTGATISQNGFIDANPSFGNTLSFSFTGTYSLSGSGNFDVFNCNIESGGSLNIGSSSMRTGKTGTITVKSGGTFAAGTGIVGTYDVLASNFVLESGATLQIGSPNGITSSGEIGNIQTTNRTFNAGADYTYNGSSFQITGNGLPITLSGTVTISNTTGVSLSNSYITTGSFVVPGVLDCGTSTISGAGSFTLNSGATLKIGSVDGITASGATGNIQTTTRSFDQGAKYVYSGSSPQVTGDGLPSTVHTFEVANPSGVTLSNGLTATGELKLTNGIITIAANNLVMGSSTLTGGSLTSYVKTNGNGTLSRTVAAATETTFPVGNTAYNPVYLTNAVSKSFTVRATSGFTGAAPVDATKIINAYWQITPENTNNLSATIKLQWNAGQEASGFNYGNGIEIGRIVGSGWVPKTANLTNNNPIYTAEASGFTSFSEFGVGNSGALPVELTSFIATTKNGTIDLKWETATEVNNHGFEVERKSATANWSKIGFVEGHGTSNSPKYYNYSDKPVGSGKFSYRLKQIDNDGQFEYSPVVEVMVDNLPNGFVLEQNYPNPFNPETSIRFALKEDTRASLKVFTAMGEEVATLFDGIAEAGRYYDVKFSGNDLSSGFYIYKLVAGDFVSVKKMILMK